MYLAEKSGSLSEIFCQETSWVDGNTLVWLIVTRVYTFITFSLSAFFIYKLNIKHKVN